MDKLEKARAEINEIDEKILKLFEDRMKAVEDVVAFKIENNKEVFDPEREAQVIEINTQKMKNQKLISYYRDYIQSMMNISKKYQQSIINHETYGYPGCVGSFSHIALQNVFPQGKMISYPTFDNVFEGLSNNEIAKGVLPFENSYTGEVGEVLDLLFYYDFKIEKIYDLKIDQNLLGVEGSSLSSIKQVYSHHQAISQCQTYLNNFDFEVVPYTNTALAAKYVSEVGDISKAAIASIETADIYGLKVLAKNINTSKDNTTRFVVIGKEISGNGDHTAILFTVAHESGQLAKIMQIVAKYGFNMENIKSRSIKNASWQYYFYMEINGSYQDKKMQEMLEECRACTQTFKIIGTYNY